MELREKLKPVAEEYAKQVGKIIGCKPEYWAGDDISMDVCCFGDTYFLSFEDMQVIVNHLPVWIERYGSKKSVGETIIAWLDFICEDVWDDEIGIYRDRPRINLYSWLKGLRPEMMEWSSTDEVCRLEQHLKTLRFIARTYPTASIDNIIMQMEARRKVLNEQVMKECEEALRKSPSFQEFRQQMENVETDKPY